MSAKIWGGNHEELSTHSVHQSGSLCQALYLQSSQPSMLSSFKAGSHLFLCPFIPLDPELLEGKNRDLFLGLQRHEAPSKRRSYW